MIENNMAVTILYTYRTFMEPVELLNQLLTRFILCENNCTKSETANIIRLRVISVIKLWINLRCYDFMNEDFRIKFKEEINETIGFSQPPLAESIFTSLQKQSDVYTY